MTAVALIIAIVTIIVTSSDYVQDRLARAGVFGRIGIYATVTTAVAAVVGGAAVGLGFLVLR